jgi:hypothetical protein
VTVFSGAQGNGLVPAVVTSAEGGFNIRFWRTTRSEPEIVFVRDLRYQAYDHGPRVKPAHFGDTTLRVHSSQVLGVARDRNALLMDTGEVLPVRPAFAQRGDDFFVSVPRLPRGPVPQVFQGEGGVWFVSPRALEGARVKPNLINPETHGKTFDDLLVADRPVSLEPRLVSGGPDTVEVWFSDVSHVGPIGTHGQGRAVKARVIEDTGLGFYKVTPMTEAEEAALSVPVSVETFRMPSITQAHFPATARTEIAFRGEPGSQALYFKSEGPPLVRQGMQGLTRQGEFGIQVKRIERVPGGYYVTPGPPSRPVGSVPPPPPE